MACLPMLLKLATSDGALGRIRTSGFEISVPNRSQRNLRNAFLAGRVQ
jgi:hypothetical protein